MRPVRQLPMTEENGWHHVEGHVEGLHDGLTLARTELDGNMLAVTFHGGCVTVNVIRHTRWWQDGYCTISEDGDIEGMAQRDSGQVVQRIRPWMDAIASMRALREL